MEEKYWVIKKDNLDPEAKRYANEYLLTIKQEQKAIATIDRYRRILERFFLDCSVPLHAITHDHVHNWLKQNYQDKKGSTLSLSLNDLVPVFRLPPLRAFRT